MYLSGLHALNIQCELETCGDWHQSALDWNKITLYDENSRFFGSYGIERDKTIPEHSGLFNVANTLRACLDLIEDGKYSILYGMKNDFLGTTKYYCELFSKVYEMRSLDNWHDIDSFMSEEFLMEWIRFKQGREAPISA